MKPLALRDAFGNVNVRSANDEHSPLLLIANDDKGVNTYSNAAMQFNCSASKQALNAHVDRQQGEMKKKK
jgi:hypothetical protein